MYKIRLDEKNFFHSKRAEEGDCFSGVTLVQRRHLRRAIKRKIETGGDAALDRTILGCR